MLNLGSKTLIPDTTLHSPGSVNAVWPSYWPGLSLLQRHNVIAIICVEQYRNQLVQILLYLPAISWYVLVMMKSAAFMAIKSAENWHEK